MFFRQLPARDGLFRWPLYRTILWAIKVMKVNMTYIIDPNEYISTVYIPKIELIKIAQGL